MQNNKISKVNSPKSQTEIDQNILDFLGNETIKTVKDLIALRNLILSSLDTRPYNNQTKKHADSIQWKRTASEILHDKYVYNGKACSDLTIVFLTLCKAAGIGGRLVKLKRIDGNSTHSIAEVNLNNTWYRFDVSNKDSIPFEGELTKESIWNKKWKVYKKGRDVWDLGFDGIESETKIY
jgi:hypothetical protein